VVVYEYTYTEEAKAEGAEDCILIANLFNSIEGEFELYAPDEATSGISTIMLPMESTCPSEVFDTSTTWYAEFTWNDDGDLWMYGGDGWYDLMTYTESAEINATDMRIETYSGDPVDDAPAIRGTFYLDWEHTTWDLPDEVEGFIYTPAVGTWIMALEFDPEIYPEDRPRCYLVDAQIWRDEPMSTFSTCTDCANGWMFENVAVMSSCDSTSGSDGDIRLVGFDDPPTTLYSSFDAGASWVDTTYDDSTFSESELAHTFYMDVGTIEVSEGISQHDYFTLHW